jgi:hypothetical protein
LEQLLALRVTFNPGEVKLYETSPNEADGKALCLESAARLAAEQFTVMARESAEHRLPILLSY